MCVCVLQCFVTVHLGSYLLPSILNACPRKETQKGQNGGFFWGGHCIRKPVYSPYLRDVIVVGFILQFYI